MAGVADTISSAIELGFFQYILPFILMFAVYYGVLRKANMFDKDNINTMISFVAASFTLYYAHQTAMLQDFLGGFLGQAGIVMVFMFIAGAISMFLFGILESLQLDNRMLKLLIFLGTFYIIFMIAQDVGVVDVAPTLDLFSADVSEDAVTGIFLIILVIAGMAWVAGEGPPISEG